MEIYDKGIEIRYGNILGKFPFCWLSTFKRPNVKGAVLQTAMLLIH